MPADEAPLAEVIRAVCDGRPVDWDSLELRSPSESFRRALAELRVVAGIADLHSSFGDVDPRHPPLAPIDRRISARHALGPPAPARARRQRRVRRRPPRLGSRTRPRGGAEAAAPHALGRRARHGSHRRGPPPRARPPPERRHGARRGASRRPCRHLDGVRARPHPRGAGACRRATAALARGAHRRVGVRGRRGRARRRPAAPRHQGAERHGGRGRARRPHGLRRGARFGPRHP
jgi:hypothetical protein